MERADSTKPMDGSDVQSEITDDFAPLNDDGMMHAGEVGAKTSGPETTSEPTDEIKTSGPQTTSEPTDEVKTSGAEIEETQPTDSKEKDINYLEISDDDEAVFEQSGGGHSRVARKSCNNKNVKGGMLQKMYDTAFHSQPGYPSSTSHTSPAHSYDTTKNPENCGKDITDQTASEPAQKKCKYDHGSPCCVEAHIKQLLQDVNSEENRSITWGRLVGARANDFPPNVRRRFMFEVESLLFQTGRGETQKYGEYC